MACRPDNWQNTQDGNKPGVPMNGHSRCAYRALLTIACLSLVATGAHCSQTLEPIFEEHDPPLAWPPPPAAPRIKYVGQLRTSADLKPPPKPFESLGNLLLGRKPPAPLYGPRSVVRPDAGNRLWVADPGGRCLHLFDLEHRTYRKLDSAGTERFMSPVGLCLGPEDSIFVCDSEQVAIHRLSATSGALIASLRLPIEVLRPVAATYVATSGELFVVDVSAHNIKVLDKGGRILRIIGRRGSAPGQFNFPCDIADDGRLLWVVDVGNQRVQALTYAGKPVTSIGQLGDAPGDLAMPKGVALDSDGHVYIVDARFENVQIFDQAKRLLLFFGEEGGGPGQFWLPSGICIDANDRIWICDSYNGRIQVYDYVRPPAEEQIGRLEQGTATPGNGTAPLPDKRAETHAMSEQHNEVAP